MHNSKNMVYIRIEREYSWRSSWNLCGMHHRISKQFSGAHHALSLYLFALDVNSYSHHVDCGRSQPISQMPRIISFSISLPFSFPSSIFIYHCVSFCTLFLLRYNVNSRIAWVTYHKWHNWIRTEIFKKESTFSMISIMMLCSSKWI